MRFNIITKKKNMRFNIITKKKNVRFNILLAIGLLKIFTIYSLSQVESENEWGYTEFSRDAIGNI